VPAEHHFAPGYALLLTGFNGTPDHAAAVDRVRDALPPLFDLVMPMPYIGLQQLLDEANAWGSYAYEKGTYIQELSVEVIDIITRQVPRKNSPQSLMLFYRLDGAFSRVGEDDTAFSGGRSPRLGAFIIGYAPDTDLLALDRGWVREFWEALRPQRSPAGTAMSTAPPITRATGCAAVTGRRNTTGWRG
jgi:hypothetical protein